MLVLDGSSGVTRATCPNILSLSSTILVRDEPISFPSNPLLISPLTPVGGTEESFTLNFSRPGAQVIAQYYNLIHLGFEGYRAIMENAMANARLLSKALESSGWYRCVSDIHRPKGQLEYKKGETYEGKDGETSADYNAGLPVVAFTLTDEFKQKYPHVKQVSISNLLRAKQYIIPSKSDRFRKIKLQTAITRIDH